MEEKYQIELKALSDYVNFWGSQTRALEIYQKLPDENLETYQKRYALQARLAKLLKKRTKKKRR